MAYTPPVDWHDQDPTTALTAARLKAMESALATYTDTTAIPKTLVDAKGDLLVGTAADTAARLAKGTDGYQLQANSATTTGLGWVRKPDVFAGDPSFNLPTNGTTDASAALTLAGQTAGISGGGVVKVPPGTYTVSGNGIHHDFNSRVFFDLRGCRLLVSGANSVGVTFNPGVLGDAGLGGGMIGGQIVCSASSQTGVKFRNANHFSLRETRIDGAGTGLLFSNDGAGKYNENHLIEQVLINPATTGTGIKWEAINGADPSLEGQGFYNVHIFGGVTGWDLGPGLNFENVEMVNCRVVAAGVPSATMIWTRGNLNGWKVSAVVEHLNSASFGGTANPNCVVMNTDSGTTNNNLADIRLHVLPQTTGSNNNATWAAAPFIKHASITQPTVFRDGPIHMMQAALGNYLMRARRDFEANDRMRLSYGAIEWGPGGSTAPDAGIGRGGQYQLTTVTSGAPLGCTIVGLPATTGNEMALAMQLASTVVHGSNANVARPTAFPIVQWVGSVTPNNAVDGDLFVDTS